MLDNYTFYFLKVSSLVPILSGATFIIVGWIMKFRPPKNINYLIGYRTPRSMKNQANWDFAQTYSAQSMIQMGYVMLIFGIGFSVISEKAIWLELLIGLGILIGTSVMLISSTESALKKSEE